MFNTTDLHSTESTHSTGGSMTTSISSSSPHKNRFEHSRLMIFDRLNDSRDRSDIDLQQIRSTIYAAMTADPFFHVYRSRLNLELARMLDRKYVVSSDSTVDIADIIDRIALARAAIESIRTVMRTSRTQDSIDKRLDTMSHAVDSAVAILQSYRNIDSGDSLYRIYIDRADISKIKRISSVLDSVFDSIIELRNRSFHDIIPAASFEAQLDLLDNAISPDNLSRNAHLPTVRIQQRIQTLRDLISRLDLTKIFLQSTTSSSSFVDYLRSVAPEYVQPCSEIVSLLHSALHKFSPLDQNTTHRIDRYFAKTIVSQNKTLKEYSFIVSVIQRLLRLCSNNRIQYALSAYSEREYADKVYQRTRELNDTIVRLTKEFNECDIVRIPDPYLSAYFGISSMNEFRDRRLSRIVDNITRRMLNVSSNQDCNSIVYSNTFYDLTRKMHGVGSKRF